MYSSLIYIACLRHPRNLLKGVSWSMQFYALLSSNLYFTQDKQSMSYVL